MTSSSAGILPYQMFLRVIGVHLDARETAAHLIIEAPGAFLVRSEVVAEEPQLAFETFTHEDLAGQFRELVGGRLEPITGRLRRSAARRAADRLEHRPRTGYEDFLRAVGYELEDAAAYSILIAQIDDQFLLTYLQLKPEEGFQTQKRMVLVDADAREDILKAAYERKGSPMVRRSMLGT